MRLQLLHQHNAHHLHTRRDPPPPPTSLNSEVSAILASKMMEDRIRNADLVESDASHRLLDANRIALLNSPPDRRTGAPPIQQQIHPRNQQLDIKPDVAIPQRTMPVDHSLLYASGMMHQKPALLAAGLNQGGVGSVPLKGWPLTVPGIDQFRSNLGAQKQLVPSSNQFQLLSPQQQLIAQAQTQNDITRIGSPSSSASPNVPSDDPDYLMKLKMAQMQQSSGHRPMELQQPHQQNSRKRKPTSSGAANSTGTGNTLGASPPSTHTPGGGVPVASNVNILQKSSIICGVEGTSGLASSSNQMDTLDSFVDFDENVDSFLSNDDGDGRDMFAALKKGSSEHNSESLKGLSLNEVGNNRTSNNKVVCCHFSTDGKLLASAGHEKKVYLWNMDNFKIDTKIEEHTNFITDIRFKTNSTQLATSSSDGTVRLWNAADESGALQTFLGHSSHVTSVDFHPRLTEVLCSSDDNGEIRFWTVGQTSSHVFRVTQGGTGRVRFQPRNGQLLAVAAGSMVNIIDVEKQANLPSPPKGHNSEVNSVCWDENGEYVASVSQDTVKVWSVASGACVHELRSHGNQYESCIFHPRYPKVLIVGGYQTLELWSLSDNQRNPIQVHEGLVAALAHSPFTGMIASASHDRYVKLWK